MSRRRSSERVGNSLNVRQGAHRINRTIGFFPVTVTRSNTRTALEATEPILPMICPPFFLTRTPQSKFPGEIEYTACSSLILGAATCERGKACVRCHCPGGAPLRCCGDKSKLEKAWTRHHNWAVPRAINKHPNSFQICLVDFRQCAGQFKI